METSRGIQHAFNVLRRNFEQAVTDSTNVGNGRDFTTAMFTVSYFFVWGFVVFALVHLVLEIVGPALYDTKPWSKSSNTNGVTQPVAAPSRTIRMIQPDLDELTAKVTEAIDNN